MIDLLSVLPYQVELILGQGTCVLFLRSILRIFRVLSVGGPFHCDHTIPPERPPHPSLPRLLSQASRTTELKYLSMCRSHHALLPPAPSSSSHFPLLEIEIQLLHRYFAERGMWVETMDSLTNSDGDPT